MWNKNIEGISDGPVDEAAPVHRMKKWPFFLCGLVAVAVFAASSIHFSLLGSARVEVALGEGYRERGAQALLFGLDLSRYVAVAGAVDDASPGEYTLSYQLEGFGWIQPLQRSVTVRDITIPDLVLARGEKLAVEMNALYVEPGYTATDNFDGDLTAEVSVEGAVDTHVPGDYVLAYHVADQFGNEARATRTVTVLSKSPLTMGLSEFTLNYYFPDVILPEAEDAGDAYLENTIFIGDSITENGLGFGYYPPKTVWAKPAIEPDTILTTPIMIYGGSPEKKDVEMLAVEAARIHQPQRVIINIGSNGIYKAEPAQFTRDYETFVRQFHEASPGTQIIISSIYPVAGRYDTSERSAYTTNNDKCNKINYALADMCRRNGWKFLNVAEALKDGNGWAREGYLYDKDGIHPKRDTYKIIIAYIRTHPYREA